MKTLYLECGMGAAGDMLMSALFELLEDREGFLDTMNRLGLPGVRLEAVKATTCGIAGTHMKVTVHGREEMENGHGRAAGAAPEHSHGEPAVHSHTHTSHRHIAELIDTLSLPEEVKAHAKAVYDAIAEAEARAHNCPVGDVHFHEVGALDAVADVTGVCLAVYLLSPDRIMASPVHVGSGTVRCAHGVLPVPAPATLALLTGIPIYGGNVKGELCTPTGAALLAHFCGSFGQIPAMTVERIGYGLGAKAFEQANCVRAFWGESIPCGAKEQALTDAGNAVCEGPKGEILELTCNIDDMTPEALAFACGRLLELGALDVYTIPGNMKKGRPGHVLTVLCHPEQEGETVRHILTETTTNGLRVRTCRKYYLEPRIQTIETAYGDVRIKTAEGYGTVHRKAEYEDVAALAKANRLSFHGLASKIEKGMND